MRPALSRHMVSASIILAASPVVAATVTFSGTVTYTGSYAADSLYVAVVDTLGPSALGYQALAAGVPPLTIPFTVSFDNAAATGPVLLAALLDADHSGFNPDSLDSAITKADVLGWYNGHPDPALLDPSAAQTGLDFPLPKAEIHGALTFAPGQTWAGIEAFSIPGDWSPPTQRYAAAGPYAIIGLYAGDWGVFATGPFQFLCYGDPTCTNPGVLRLAEGEIRTGIDVDFRVSAVAPRSWSRIKELYR